MIEDLGSASDFDFNDVVVDVEKIEPTKVEITQNAQLGTQAKLTKVSLGQSLKAETHAIVRVLCGTRPFKLYVGDHTAVNFGQQCGDYSYLPNSNKLSLKKTFYSRS